MIRFIIEGGRVEIERHDLEQLLLEVSARATAEAEAHQRAMMKVWKLGKLTAADRQNPHIGLLKDRLGICEKSCYRLITEGELAHLPTGGSKGYRVTERMICDYENKHRHLPKAAPVPPPAPPSRPVAHR